MTSGAPLHILLLQGNELVGQTFTSLIMFKGHCVDRAKSLEQCQQLLQTNRYDILLCDDVEHLENLVYLIEDAKRMRPTMHVIVSTASTVPDAVKRCTAIERIISKPFSIDLLEKIYANAIV